MSVASFRATRWTNQIIQVPRCGGRGPFMLLLPKGRSMLSKSDGERAEQMLSARKQSMLLNAQALSTAQTGAVASGSAPACGGRGETCAAALSASAASTWHFSPTGDEEEDEGTAAAEARTAGSSFPETEGRARTWRLGGSGVLGVGRADCAASG